MSELELEVPDPTSGSPLGWLIIDSCVNGRSHGGLRVSKYVSKEELLLLARRMTLKFGFLGLANGGAKAGIIGDPEASWEIRQSKMKQFADFIAPLVKMRRYLPHPDMGTNELEIRQAFRNVRIPHQPNRDQSGHFTGIGVFIAVRVIARKMGMDMGDLKIAIEGFGKVGSSVAGLLADAGAKITAISTSFGALYKKEGLPIQEMQKKAAEMGSRFVLNYDPGAGITKEELLHLPVDVLIPCANSGTISRENVNQIQARIICPGANAPITSEADAMLASRSIMSLPDFITNAGGVLGGTMAFAGIPVNRIRALMQEYLEPRFLSLFEMSRSEVEQYCVDRFFKAKQRAEQGGIKRKIFQLGLSLYRKGFVPKFLVSKFASQYFRSR